MKKYSILLFDADHTLLDFVAAERDALLHTFQIYGYPYNEVIKQQFLRINKKLWTAYECGEITREEVIYTRFKILFQELGISDDGIQFEKDYQAQLANGHEVIKDAMEVVQALYKEFDLYIASNGVCATQYKRLDESHLRPYFKDVFVSEELGYQKPNPNFFYECFNRIGQVDKNQVLMIGDSLSSDIQGGMNAGIATCWFNPEGNKHINNVVSTYDIRTLKEVYDIVGKEYIYE